MSTRNSASDSRVLYDRSHNEGIYVGAGGAWRVLPQWRMHMELVSYDRDESMLSIGLRFGL